MKSKKKSILLKSIQEEKQNIMPNSTKGTQQSSINVIKQAVYGVYTTHNNSIKNAVLTNLAVTLAKKTNQKILIMDWDMPLPVLDHMLGVTKEIYVNEIYSSKILTGMSACFSAIEKNSLTPSLFKDFIKPVNGFENLDILTGMYDMDLLSKFEINHFDIILDCAKKLYDTIFISLNPFISSTATYYGLINSTKVLVVSEPTYANGRSTLDVLKEYINFQGCVEDKFEIIITNSDIANKDIDKKLYEGFNVLGYIRKNNHYLNSINDKKPLVLSSYGSKDLIDYINLISALGYVPKVSFLQRFKKQQI